MSILFLGIGGRCCENTAARALLLEILGLLLSDAASSVIWSDWNNEGFWFPFILWVLPECYSDSVFHKRMPHCVDMRPYQGRLGFIGLPRWSWN